jgi:maleylacetoacetate isomerase
MILYGFFRSSAAYRVRIAMNLKGLVPEHRSIQLAQKLNRTPEYKAVNPQGFVPYLIEDESDTGGNFALSQSLAIIEYLDETHPEPPLLPKDPRDRAFARSIAQIIACDIHPLNNPRVLDTLAADFSMNDSQRTQWYCHWIHEGFTAIEALLERDEKGRGKANLFCVGDMPTIADICLIPQVANANRFKCALDKFPRILAINDRALKLPAFDLAQPIRQTDAQ